MTQIMKMETNEIEIPKGMLRKRPKLKSARLYALSKSTIGISFEPVKEWSKKAIWEGEAHVTETGGSVFVDLPHSITSFYSITQEKITISASSRTNTIQVDVQ